MILKYIPMRNCVNLFSWVWFTWTTTERIIDEDGFYYKKRWCFRLFGWEWDIEEGHILHWGWV